MTAGGPGLDIDANMDGRLRLEELVHRDALTELCTSFFDLFGIPVRIYSSEGVLVADVAKAQEICGYINTSPRGRAACANVVGGVRRADPGVEGDVVHPCFTGAAYRIIGIDYEGRRIGRLIVGPYLPAQTVDMPASLLATEPTLDAARAHSLLFEMPRAKSETITRLAAHLKAVLDLVLFSGHRALLTSHMHLASVRENYRELEDKNRKLQEAYDRLKELDRLKSNFLATVSHELRTPLTSIIGYSEMLLAGIAGTLLPEQTEFAQTIFDKGQQLLSLILGLLDLSKLESGTMSVKLRRTELGPVVVDALSTLTPVAQKKSVKLDVVVPADLPAIQGDPERLRQIIQNLVENAIKFTPAGAAVTIVARLLPLGSAAAHSSEDDDTGFALLAPVRSLIEVRVIDSGIGIPDREKAKVFDAFYQVDSSSTREYGGTGLGLSIVKRLVEAHDGKVKIEDNVPHGAIFVVTLPVARDGANGPRVSSSPGLSASDSRSTPPGTVQ
jgi:two-component system sensor histidine kinase BarA